MSNFDATWTERDDAASRKLGWRLFLTVDNGDTHPYWMVADAGGHGNAEKAQAFVLKSARERHDLSIKALTACAQSRVGARSKR